MERIKLLKKYSKNGHLGMFDVVNVDIGYVFNNDWLKEDGKKLSNIQTSYLLDSYYNLPERPDIAFTYLWRVINTTYLSINSSSDNYTDASKIKKTIDEIIRLRNSAFTYLGQEYTILSVIKNYASAVPIKPLKFFANVLLKGYALDSQMLNKFKNVKTYKSLKKYFESVGFWCILKETYLDSYCNISTPMLNSVSEIDFGVSEGNEKKSRALTHSLADQLQQLLCSKTVIIEDEYKTKSFRFEFDEDQLITFVFSQFLYGLRNNDFHGNIASRLSSVYVKRESVIASWYTYLLGYLYLSLLLYVDNAILLTDLAVNVENLNKYKIQDP